MKLLDRPEVNAWWALAQSDLRVAGVVAALEPPELHLACFLSQQAGEKAFKAVLEAHDRPVPRTHSLMVLRAAVGDVGVDVSHLAEPAAILTDYGVGPRYPLLGQATRAEDAAEALDAARVLMSWAERVLTG